ncbi:MAG: antiholin-like protein LrgB [Furfurilactobacillus sp.]|jgi:holin-like protein LrgB|uniref:antiholin-like protein LrgB n=1 Tax=Furfurilactobacillus TaxID=2767882 RepID=UPI001F1631FC|nr:MULTISPECIES: antiholin-like protein LrgB [Furfurilactobacillus]MCF6420033.1 antiholin-like protein LrgB [Furfurilactobacillus milii]MCH4012203.1 antiholin-like protein LrgB [Furfurilactobacillus sp.]MCH4038095.1 antiholin-like protein LrgB [Furfurilactobacillus sp.]MCH4115268.1 antiholin-like protein LrgB [Furfurilactobacillus sp.]MCI1340022.1 antiholin-like protein LrgB [Furfurilactobacillus sp.]
MASTFILAAAAPVIKGPLAYFVTPFFGIVLSIAVYLLGQWLFKISKGFFLFQPLFVGMVMGILALAILAKWLGMDTAAFYTQAYKPGGDIIFWFLNPATIAFAIPLYKRNDIVKKFWLEILLSLIVGVFIALSLIFLVAKGFGLSKVGLASMLPQAATTAIALPISTAIGGNAAVTAMACILNAVIIYALGNWLVKIFRLKSDPIGTGLGLGTSGHTIGSAFALELGTIEGSMGAIAVVIIGIVVDLVVPIFATLVGLR